MDWNIQILEPQRIQLLSWFDAVSLSTETDVTFVIAMTVQNVGAFSHTGNVIRE